METLRGTPVQGGIAIAKIWVLRSASAGDSSGAGDCQTQLKRLHDAVERSIRSLNELRGELLSRGETDAAAVIEVHAMMLEDEDFISETQSAIKRGFDATKAILSAGDVFAKRFEAMDDEYLKERAADVRAAAHKVAEMLNGNIEMPSEPSILAAEELTPDQALRLPRDLLKGIVTKKGAYTAHMAILARGMGVAAMFGVDVKENWHGKCAILDADAGILTVDPSLGALVAAKKALLVGADSRRSPAEQLSARPSKTDKPTQTKSGVKVSVCANISDATEADTCLSNGAEGVGLFRSEFLFLGRKDRPPTEDEQYEQYKAVVERLAPKPVVIRTLDIGADKRVDYLNLVPEANPALGYRAIRICLDRPELFKAQLRALLRASAHGNLSVMYPMITSPEEFIRCKEILSQCEAELTQEDVEHGKPRQGVMIETPAAVMMSRELASEAAFFSVGTNDLTQYTLACDRLNENVASLYDSRHPAVLRLMKIAIDAAKERNIPVCVCGEMASDHTMTQTLIDMGVGELSVAPGAIPALREHISALI